MSSTPGLISFEGGIATGKTSLTKVLSTQLRLPALLEDFQQNPFLGSFYGKADNFFETEAAFLLIHSAQLKIALSAQNRKWILSDFSIEKDLVFARMNLRDSYAAVFERMYGLLVKRHYVPKLVFLLRASPDVARKRLIKRGRDYEGKANATYFERYQRQLENFLQNESRSEVVEVDAEHIDIHKRSDPRILQIGAQIRSFIRP